MRAYTSAVRYSVGIFIWIGIVVVIVLLSVPQQQLYGRGVNDPRQIFPDAFEMETSHDAQQREFRWIRPQGVMQLFTKPNRGFSVVTLEVNAMPVATMPIPIFTVMHHERMISMPVHAGWRRVQFLLQPSAYSDGYTSFSYQVVNSTLHDVRGSLGMAVHRVIVTPTQRIVDWLWVLYIAVMAILVALLWHRLRFAGQWLIGIGVASAGGLYVLLPAAEWYIPTSWHILGLCVYLVVLFCVKPYCRPRVFSPVQLVVAMLLAVACLRWVLPLGLVVVAIIYLWGLRTIAVAEYLPKAPDFIERWMVVILMVLAALVRFWDINNTGMGLFRDEARHGALSLKILNGEHFAFSSFASLPSGYFYLSTIPISIFGASPFAIRMVAAVAGVMTIPLVVWVLRPLWGRQVAIIVAALFTMSLWHISISRMGFPISLGPLVTLIAIGAIDRGTRPKRARWQQFAWAAVCGLMVGATTLIYHSARLMPAVIVVFGLTFVWRRRLAWQRVVPVVAVVGIFALVAAFPIIKFAIEHPFEYWYRIKLTSLVNWADIHGIWWGLAHVQNVVAYLGMWLVQGDANPRQYSFGLPQLDFIAGSGFLLGAWLWWHYRRDLLTYTVGVWFVVSVLAGIFSVDAPHAWRSAENMTPTFIIAAWGIVAFMRRLPQSHIYRVILVCTVFGVVYSGGTYMAIQRTPDAFDAFEGQATAAVRMAQVLSADPRTQVGLLTNLYTADAGDFLLSKTTVQGVAPVMSVDWTTMPANVTRQIVITSTNELVEWHVPHETYVARDAWHRPSYVVLCRGDCQAVASLFTPAQMGIAAR